MLKVPRVLKFGAIGVGALLLIGFLIPEQIIIPVKGATNKDWNLDTF